MFCMRVFLFYKLIGIEYFLYHTFTLLVTHSVRQSVTLECTIFQSKAKRRENTK